MHQELDNQSGYDSDQGRTQRAPTTPRATGRAAGNTNDQAAEKSVPRRRGGKALAIGPARIAVQREMALKGFALKRFGLSATIRRLGAGATRKNALSIAKRSEGRPRAGARHSNPWPFSERTKVPTAHRAEPARIILRIRFAPVIYGFAKRPNPAQVLDCWASIYQLLGAFCRSSSIVTWLPQIRFSNPSF